MPDALALYRARFQPSAQLARPYVLLGVNVFAAETDAAAQRLFTSLQKQFTRLFRGAPGKLEPPCDIETFWTPAERAGVQHALRHAAVGGPDTVRRKLAEFARQTQADELMLTAQIHDHAARLRSFEIAADLAPTIARERDEARASSAG